ncbi:MAG: hypothetical protein U5L00_17995 [Desulfovermiculus sp.]|nr:hypothetical protein [Desulfovermiculus sp.]
MFKRLLFIFLFSFLVCLCSSSHVTADAPFSTDHFQVYDDFESQEVNSIKWKTENQDGNSTISDGSLIGTINAEGEYFLASRILSRGWAFSLSRDEWPAYQGDSLFQITSFIYDETNNISYNLDFGYRNDDFFTRVETFNSTGLIEIVEENLVELDFINNPEDIHGNTVYIYFSHDSNTAQFYIKDVEKNKIHPINSYKLDQLDENNVLPVGNFGIFTLDNATKINNVLYLPELKAQVYKNGQECSNCNISPGDSGKISLRAFAGGSGVPDWCKSHLYLFIAEAPDEYNVDGMFLSIDGLYKEAHPAFPDPLQMNMMNYDSFLEIQPNMFDHEGNFSFWFIPLFSNSFWGLDNASFYYGENDPPVVEILEIPSTLCTDSSFDVVGAVSDSYGIEDIEAISVSIDGGDSVQIQPDNDGLFSASLTAPEEPGSYTCTVTATDTQNQSDSQTVDVSVVICNEPPTVAINTITPTEPCAGEAFDVAGTVSDPDGINDIDSLSVSINGGNNVQVQPDNNGSFTANLTAPDNPGTYTVTVSTTDSQGQSDSQTVDVSVVICNEPPTVAINTITPTEPCAGEAFDVAGTVSDPDGINDIDSLSVSINGGNNVQVQPDNNGSFTANLTAPDNPGTYTVTVSTTDSQGQSDSQTVDVSVVICNEPPTVAINTITPTEPCAGEAFDVAGTVSDPDGINDIDSLSVSINGGDNVQVQPDNNGSFTANLTAPDNPETYTVTVSTTDSQGQSDSQTVDVSVVICNEPPTVAINTITPTEPCAGEAFDVAGTVSDPDGINDIDSLSVSINGGNNVQVQPDNNGSFTANLTAPDNPGTYTVTVSTTDSQGQSDSQTVDVSVVICNEPPTVAINTITPTEPCAGEAFDVAGTVSDPDGINDIDSLSVSINGGDNVQVQPDNNGSFTANLTAPDNPGTYTVTVSTTDSQGQSDSQTVDVSVVICNEPPTVAINTITPTEPCAGEAFDVAGTVSDPDGINDIDSLSVSINGGDNVQVQPDNNGSFTANLTAPDNPGTYTITVTATDSQGQTANTTTDVQVDDCSNQPPEISVTSELEVCPNTQFTISGYVNDPDGDTVNINADGYSPITVNAQGSFNFNDPGRPSGVYNVSIWATDIHGKRSNIENVSIISDSAYCIAF